MTPMARTARWLAATAVSTTRGTVRSTLHRASCTTVWAGMRTSQDLRTRVLGTRPASRRTTDVAVSNVIRMALFVILLTFHCCPNVSNLTRAWHRPNVRTLERFSLASSQCQTPPPTANVTSEYSSHLTLNSKKHETAQQEKVPEKI